jgi:hypothetical protein
MSNKKSILDGLNKIIEQVNAGDIAAVGFVLVRRDDDISVGWVTDCATEHNGILAGTHMLINMMLTGPHLEKSDVVEKEDAGTLQ